MALEIKGKCIAVLPLETGMGKKGEWKKLNFVIEYGEEYPKQVCLQLFGDRVNNTPAVGDNLTCKFSLESREYNGKYYTTATCWSIEGFTGNLKKKVGGAPASDDNLVWDTPSTSSAPKASVTAKVDDTDELPF